MTEKQRSRHRGFAIDNKDKDWSKTIFSDEKKFKLFDLPNPQNDIVWDSDSENVPDIEVEKCESSVHVWAGISKKGPIAIKIYDPPPGYQTVLAKSHFVANAREKVGDDWEFQQDGARPHTAKSTQRWLQSRVPKFIAPEDWPTNSPDLTHKSASGHPWSRK